MNYMYSKISLVFAIWGVSKDTVFALSSVLLKDSVFAFANFRPIRLYDANIIGERRAVISVAVTEANL